MRAGDSAIAGIAAIVAAGAFAMDCAWAQLQLPPARAPCSVLSGRPCHPSFCSVFHRGPCFPDYGIPFGENLQLTIVSTDDAALPQQPGSKAGPGAADNGHNSDQEATHPVDTIRAMFAALRACWVPPPPDQARHGMQYTLLFALKRDGALIGPPRRTYSSHDAPAAVRDVYAKAADAAIDRCTPLHLSTQMGNAIAGRPIAVRFVDNRSIDSGKKATP
jgi:hypothetical protein